MSNKLWIAIAFFSILIIFIIISIFNYKIDSLGLFKDTSYDKIAKDLANGKVVAGLSNFDERIFRKKQIEHLKNDVQYIAIGSSRIMQLRKNMFLNNKINNFQNYSVSGASIEDYIALLQIHRNKFGTLPKNIIFGLDAWIFNKNNGQTRYLSLNDEYLQFRKDLNTKKEFNQQSKSKFFYLLSLEYAKKNNEYYKKNKDKNIQNLQYYTTDTIEVDDSLKMPDGSIYYPYKNRFPDFNEVAKVAESYTKVNVYSLERFEDLSNIDLFEKFINYLKNNDVNVYFYLPPYNPITYDILVSNEKYKIIEKVEDYLKKFSKKNDIKLVGSYNPHRLNLKNEHFFDGMHSLDSVYEIIFKDLL
ncbi:hypothetical protein PJV93_08395 [Aliarcobacter butzleri]|uniref:Uncharacterized protein n=1 Tax=Aliarcobacter butzleri TaxID=28197 RepID=A0AAW7QCT8_9BACT|nr:hypothetical protein [Aliarcobacter butzleri]MDN5107168.1 hypothetical protein [Aliarcobacter butzleri]MDN5123918.1 hypothetical protein [Aliarcobacter butzleri]